MSTTSRLVRDISKLGWTVERTAGGLLKCTHPDASRPVFTAPNMRNYRGWENLRHTLLRATQPQEELLLEEPLADVIQDIPDFPTFNRHKRKGMLAVAKAIDRGSIKCEFQRPQPKRAPKPPTVVPAQSEMVFSESADPSKTTVIPAPTPTPETTVTPTVLGFLLDMTPPPPDLPPPPERAKFATHKGEKTLGPVANGFIKRPHERVEHLRVSPRGKIVVVKGHKVAHAHEIPEPPQPPVIDEEPMDLVSWLEQGGML